jgi:hypothetical protein
MEAISRRVLAPGVTGSLVQTHWYYERARGQHLNDQAGMSAAKKAQFLRMNPRSQVVTKTDLAKVENCFAQLPDIACKGAEKSFTEFAERITKEWQDEGRRDAYGDEWFKGAIARTILFRTAECLVSEATWYEGGYRAQIVAYTIARIARLAQEESDQGSIDFSRIWAAQAADEVLSNQMLMIGEVMARVLRDPPQAGQNISEWAKQQACRKRALETEVPIEPSFRLRLVAADDARSVRRSARAEGRVDRGLTAQMAVMSKGASFWENVRSYAARKNLLFAEDERALLPACNIPRMVPTDRQAERLVGLLTRCQQEGFSA